MIDPTLGLRLSLSAIDAEFKHLNAAMRDVHEALEREETLVTMKVCMDELEKRSRWIASVAAAEASRISDHLNRHATAA
jgi:hypothetical protein